MDVKTAEFIERLKVIVESRDNVALQQLFDNMLRYRMEADLPAINKTLDNLIKVVNTFLWNRQQIVLRKLMRSFKRGG